MQHKKCGVYRIEKMSDFLYIYDIMIYQKTISIILVCCLSSSIAWCVDYDFVNSTDSDQSVVLLGMSSAQQQNSSTHSSDNHTANCSCICHVPSVGYKSLLLSYSPPFEIMSIHSASNLSSVPGSTIFRPPSAA
jgi:hypothetical protein